MMKKMLMICFLAMGFVATAQDKIAEKELVGTWKPVSLSMNNGMIYIDMEKDSMHLSDDVKKSWKSKEDSAMVMAIMHGLAKRLIEMELIYKTGGTCSMKTGKKTNDGTYVIDATGTKVSTSIKNEEKMIAVPYKDQLKIESELGEGKIMVMVMKKKG